MCVCVWPPSLSVYASVCESGYGIIVYSTYLLFYLCPGPFPYGYDLEQEVNRNAETFLDTEHGHGANDGSIRSEVASFIDICCCFFRSLPPSLTFTTK